MTSAAFDVAIVGGGASGTLLAAELLRRARGRLRLLMLDRAGDFTRGIAYRTREPVHVLNVPARKMSAVPGQEAHFLDWLREREPTADDDTYARRGLYGEYLSSVLDAAERSASRGTLTRRRGEVRRIRIAGDGLRLLLGDAGEVRCRHAVLAMGNFPPAPLPATPAARARLWSTPWPTSSTPWPRLEDSVLLVGAGLTAVDLVLSLAAREHKGQVDVLSRHGRWPNPHLPRTTPPLEEVEAPEGRVRPLMHALRTATAGQSDWRAVVDGIRSRSHRLWRSFPEVERRRFARHVRTLWEVHRHRIAPEVAAELDRLTRTGQVRLRAGRLLGLDAVGDRIEARLRFRGQLAEERQVVDLVVNCTGPAGHASHPDALVSALLADGLARPGPLGLGLATDLDGAVRSADGRPGAGLWALGPLRRGELWEAGAIPEIRAQAEALAGRLLSATAV